ncbi:MAG: hypothetical protein QOE70_1620 [Chthoniobacter sp.]|jgi:hypothetical protein|nr:hypothetical protein [Chthoniobacter sp.]
MTPKTSKRKTRSLDAAPTHTLEVQSVASLAPPRIDPDLTTLDPIERAAETLRYSALRTEYWLSPKGLLREWLRRILQLGVAVLVPLLIFAPLISVLLEKCAGWSAQAVVIAANLSKVPVKLSSGVALTAVGVLLLRWLFRR